jgi:type I restriction-modification system DNA methylase subunit
MANEFELIYRLTTGNPSKAEMSRWLRDFAQQLGWEPSDRLEPAVDMQDVTNGHLVVEQGLEESAVITFLKSPVASLQPAQITKLLSISYNNLIDWHIYVEADKVTFAYVRSNQPASRSFAISQSNIEYLKSTMFDQIVGATPNPNFPTLDQALIDNIATWKRMLAADLNGKPERSAYAALFNAIMFTRAVEDHAKRYRGVENQILTRVWEQLPIQQRSLSKIIEKSIADFVASGHATAFLELQRLSVFDPLAPEEVYALLGSFYKSRQVPYAYDFAIMSKHALSRIYEHYVSLLRFEDEDPQLKLFPSLPREEIDRSYGSVYTPQFIARFFARFLREQMPPRAFQQLKTLDPACGSGIFLRTLLEVQCAPSYDGISSKDIVTAFDSVIGIDIDENAIQASKLSLALLYMVLMSGQLPDTLQLDSADAQKYFTEHPNMRDAFGAVVVNPPFVSFDDQPLERRQAILDFMGDLAIKRPDTYLPFLKLGIDALKPEGFGLFVLPHTFLKSVSGAKVRTYLHERAWIRCLVDLSSIPVFNDRGSYVILLLFQKLPETAINSTRQPDATIIRCQDLVGHALQDYLANRKVQNDFYTIFDVGQEVFSQPEWMITTPDESSVRRKFQSFQLLKEFFEVRQGVVTGADDIFIVRKEGVPVGEEKIWLPLLRDRDMERYKTPRTSTYFVFYPLIDGQKLSQQELQNRYVKTWQYLKDNRDKLEHRSPHGGNWWEPTRLRNPAKLYTPKIITPHLVLLPKFSLDSGGKYAVSHSPYLIPKAIDPSIDLMKFFLVVLNSTVGAWLISMHSDKYSRGYARLEVKTLSSIPVPNPSEVSTKQLKAAISMVDKKLQGDLDAKIDGDIDNLVAELYGLTHDERLLIGFEGQHATNKN